MTATDIRALGYRVYDAINAKDVDALEDLFDPQVIRHAAGEIGFDSAKKAVINLFKTAPQTRFVVEDLFADGDRIALRVNVYEDAAEEQPRSMIMEIFRVANGRIAEIWGAGSSYK